MNIYAEIFKAFNNAKIEYLIVGGVAVNLYGYNRFTGDIDILLALDKINLEKKSSWPPSKTTLTYSCSHSPVMVQTIV